MEYTLNIGDLMVSRNTNAAYHCLGLGSCIGLFLHDRQTGISGGAHILLPDADPTSCENKFYTVGAAVHELLMRFVRMGSTLENIRAKMAGGASVISIGDKIGQANAEQLTRHLVERKIFIAARDLGGNQCRTAKFMSNSGLMTVRFSLTNEQRFY